LLFWALFAFLEAYIHKVKDRETADHNDLNTTVGDVELTRASPHSLSCVILVWELKIFGFEISFDFIIF
jgi:hypothetical protein